MSRLPAPKPTFEPALPDALVRSPAEAAAFYHSVNLFHPFFRDAVLPARLRRDCPGHGDARHAAEYTRWKICYVLSRAWHMVVPEIQRALTDSELAKLEPDNSEGDRM